jgi:hypothetical protein
MNVVTAFAWLISPFTRYQLILHRQEPARRLEQAPSCLWPPKAIAFVGVVGYTMEYMVIGSK